VRKSRLDLLVIVAVVFLGGTAEAADNFCTDCAWALVGPQGAQHRDAQCCMARDDTTCWGGYTVDEANVGAGCIVRVDEEGDEWCNSFDYDQGCPRSGGGDDGCVSVNGYCPPECTNCRPSV
jgi:hypothetical protein